KQDLFKLTRENGAPCCRKADEEPDGDFPIRDFTCRPLQHLLSAPADAEKAALAGTFCAEREGGELPGKLSQQIIRQRDPAVALCEIRLRKSRRLQINVRRQMRRGGEGISLHMVDGQYIR